MSKISYIFIGERILKIG